MKVMKRPVWLVAIGLGVALSVVGLSRYRSSKNEIVVRLVNAQTGAVLTNVIVSVEEVSPRPVIGSIPWIPVGWRVKTSSQTHHAVDGTFRVRRISEAGPAGLTFVFSYRGSAIAAFGYGPETFGEKPVAPSGEVTIELDVPHPKR
jgi:hypothetical protein